jgi:flagellin
MSRIHANIPSLRAAFQLRRNLAEQAEALHRLSTGLRINRGADDPAGLVVSERLRADARGIDQALGNISRADNLLATVEGALNEISALLIELHSLVVRASNEAGLTAEEVKADQQSIDSILASIDRIADTTRFGDQPLLNGSRAYLLSSIPTAAFGAVSVFSAVFPQGAARTVKVTIAQSAQPAKLVFVGATPGAASVTSATTIALRGKEGSELISFVAGTRLADIRDSINGVKGVTGVSAVVSTPALGAAASALLLNSTALGADAFVSVRPIGGNFVSLSAGAANVERRDEGREPTLYVDGQSGQASGGVRVDIRSGDLEARLFLTNQFAQTTSSATFTITGGGSIFQITPAFKPGGQLRAGWESVSTSHLGYTVNGLLHTLRSGGDNALAAKNFIKAQRIVEAAVEQIAADRARLGAWQRDRLDPIAATQTIAFENITAAESAIRDADMAEEVSALTRAQVLVQSTQAVLRIAQSTPNLVLALLG